MYSICNSYNTGNIKAGDGYCTGGVAGSVRGNINSNYNIGIMNINSSIRGGIAGFSGYRIPISNNYYLDGLAEVGVYSDNGSGSTNRGTISIISEELKQKAKDLGEEVWKDDIGINDGYPILAWQTDNDKLNLINGDNAFVEDTNNINNGYPILAWQVKNCITN